MRKCYTLDEAYELLDEISSTFVKFLENLLEISKTQKINLVGIGNSISAGWTAVDSNVQPWLEKMRPFVDDKRQKSGIKLNFGSFAKIGDNSNQTTYEFLKDNPSLEDVRNHFSTIFDRWKRDFKGTPFENYVDKEIALRYYSSGGERFFDFYGDDSFTITSFNGCTEELILNMNSIFQKGGLDKIFQKEFLYLQKILLLINISANSYVTVGNFPTMSRRCLFPLNYLISKINEQLKELVSRNERCMFFDGITMDLINIVDGKIKIDNHPNLAWQYTSLYNYIIYLMNNLPLIMMQRTGDYDFKKYRGLDYDGKMELRMKQIR